MPERMVLTEKRVQNLPRPSQGEAWIHDDDEPGLALRLRATGGASWYLMRWRHGRQHKVALGSWPGVSVEQARTLAAAARSKVLAGGDPIAEKRQEAIQTRGGKVPILDALARHLDALRDRGRSEGHVADLEHTIRAAWEAGVKDLADPGIAGKADRWLRSQDQSDQTRNRQRRHLIAVGKTALRWWPPSVLGREPFLALGGEGAPMPPPAVFTPAEASRLASDEALAQVEDGGPLWFFLLMTGCRYKEAAWMRWDRIDLERGRLEIIPPNADEHAAGARVKRNRARTVLIQPELTTVLLSWPRSVPFLFTDAWRSTNRHPSMAAWRRHLAALGIAEDGRHPHSLRHTHAALAIAAGEDSMRLRLSMGHAGPEMQAHYAAQAMRWRGLLAGWGGIFRLRDPAEVARLSGADAPLPSVACQ